MALYDPVSGLTGTARQYFNRPQRTTAMLPWGARAGGQFSSTGQYIGARPGDQTQGAAGGFPGAQSYSQLLGSDPGYQQTLADLGAQNVADRSGLKSARQRAIVQFGELPDFSTLDQTAVGEGLGEDIDEVTRQLASKNTQEGLSVAARLNKQHEENVRQLTNYLSSRGLLRSGETGYRLGEEQQNYKTAQYDSRQKLLDYLSQYQTGYLQGLAQRRAAQTAAAGGAFERGVETYGNTPFGVPGAPPPGYAPPPPPPPPPPALAEKALGSPYYGEYAAPELRRGYQRAI